jgi:hypothetical protein
LIKLPVWGGGRWCLGGGAFGWGGCGALLGGVRGGGGGGRPWPGRVCAVIQIYHCSPFSPPHYLLNPSITVGRPPMLPQSVALSK